jgi:hypothetical protein
VSGQSAAAEQGTLRHAIIYCVVELQCRKVAYLTDASQKQYSREQNLKQL